MQRFAHLSHTYAVLTALTVVTASPAVSQGWIEIERPRDQVIPVGPVARVASRVQVRLNDRIARVEVEERFRNGGGMVAEGSYLYPLAGGAAFQDFSLWMGDQELRGEMLDAAKAQGIYNEIVRRRKDPALLTLAGHGLVRAQVFPIQPGETRKVALRYTQLLTRAGDALRFRYPLGERGPASFAFSLTVENAGRFGTPYSPTHQLDVRRTGGGIEVTLDGGAAGNGGGSAGDVEILVPLQRGLVSGSVLTHAPAGEDGYFMLLLAPSAAEIADALPRDVTLVVDVSGSMSGTKMDQARSALRQTLGTLAPADRFRVIAFSSTVREFRPGFTRATPAEVADVQRFVDGLTAEGGTNISGALDAALTGGNDGEGRRFGGDGNRLSIVLFITDGLPSIGEQMPDRIAASAAAHRDKRRIFTVGLGHDVNTYLLDRLAAEGHGSAEYVAPNANVEEALGSLAAKIRHPALLDLRIDDAPVSFSELTPARLPDLFHGEELVVFGRYRGRGSGAVALSGERNGRRERFTVEGEFAGTTHDNDFIPRLWASRRIGDLTRQIRLEGSTALIEQVRDLGLRYGILTEYTSYLVQEPEALARTASPRRQDERDGEARPVAPAAQTGSSAFERARTSAKLREAKSLAQADEVQRRAEAEFNAGGPSSAARTVAGRVFVRRGGVWTDATHRDSVQVTVVAPFSDAYFALVRALPELAAWLRAGDEVLVAGRRASIRIAPSGVTTWRTGELQRLTAAFRGA
ncbi:MAG TPA: VIT domain-containing protein [Gemmatimonadales bacterium]|nr:VIT domain-containing protein [Gemmatimonadales bacterium]